MKVFDCFTLFNELDLLEFRLKYLDPVADHFVIAESNLTHSGQPKPYHFQEARARFSRWENKIIYLPVRQSRQGLVFEPQTGYDPRSASWQLENAQRNALLEAFPLMDKNDLVILGDLDEIPSRAGIRKARHLQKPLAFSMLFHYYFLNCQSIGECRWWKGSIAATAEQFKTITPQGLRDNRDVYPSIPNAGWHFSYLGGIEKIRQKLVSFAHTEYQRPDYIDPAAIETTIAKGGDILKREGYRFRYVPLSYYPRSLQQVMKEYPAHIRDPKHRPWAGVYYTLRRLVRNKSL